MEGDGHTYGGCEVGIGAVFINENAWWMQAWMGKRKSTNRLAAGCRSEKLLAVSHTMMPGLQGWNLHRYPFQQLNHTTGLVASR